jgi:fucose permease
MSAQLLKTKSIPPSGQFVRTHLIWIYYALVGLGCYIMSALGPVMPFLRTELSMNYRLVGLHFSAFAMGSVLAGTIGDKIVHKLGRVQSLWFSVGGTICGLLSFICAVHPAFTILGILACGFCGSMTYQTLATVISEQLGENRTLAFMEAEVVAMLVGGAAPFAVSASVSAKFGWRAAFVVLILFYMATFPSLKKFGPAKEATVKKESVEGKLPLAYWSYALVIFLSVAAEWSTAFWSADYLTYKLAISKAAAAAAVGAFFVGMVCGRFSGSRLVRWHTATRLLAISGFISVVGFLLFWLGNTSIVNITGLFLTGLGIANMYPLSFAAAVAAAQDQASKAIARVSLTCGGALLVMPIGLSFIADRAGLFNAYYVVAFDLLICLGTIFWAGAISRRGKVALEK